MSILGTMITKHAEQAHVDTGRVREQGVRYASAFLAAQEKFAALVESGELENFADAVEAGLQKAALEAPALLVLEKRGEYTPGESYACPASEEEIAVFAASTAEKLAESLDPEELANPDVQEGIVRIAVALTHHAAMDENLPPWLEDKIEGEDGEDGGDDEDKDKDKDKDKDEDKEKEKEDE